MVRMTNSFGLPWHLEQKHSYIADMISLVVTLSNKGCRSASASAESASGWSVTFRPCLLQYDDKVNGLVEPLTDPHVRLPIYDYVLLTETKY